MTSNFVSAAIMAPITGGGHGSGDATRKLPPLQNRCGSSKSPYIRSQQGSLVSWQLLDNESVERAKKENKLLFLHIGYKACHHCRLISLESFSNPECAAVMNHSFIPVIVDREQRPDIDTIYMNYIQAVSNAGGWPLNLFLTADLEPVFGGTYWPGPSTNRRTSSDNDEEVLDFLSILKKVRDVWHDQESRCRKEAKEVIGQLRDFAAEGTLGTKGIAGIKPLTSSVPGSVASAEPAASQAANPTEYSELDLDQLEEAYSHVAGTFDPLYGGFGLAPKFLTPPKLAFLLQLGKFPSAVQDVVGEAECKHATDMAVYTLRKIRDSSLRDHLGGSGFARCSITPDWSIPNFERLIVDNALLLTLYLDAWLLSGGTPDNEFFNVLTELADYLCSPPVLLPEGAFASSEAADSHYRRGDRDMIEGAYHLWTRREFDSVVDAADKHISPIVAAYWDVQEDGNVEQQYDPNDDFINQNILRVVKTAEELSKQFSLPVEQVEQYIETARRELRSRREKDRIRPELDDKVVAGWNGLVISALAKSAFALRAIDAERSQRYLEVATGAASFIKARLWDQDNKVLYRMWRDGRETSGFADDYAYLIQGLLDLFGASGDEALLQFADILLKTQISLFYDPAGAFYSTVSSSPHTIIRLKDGMDTSLPSSNAVSVSNLFRLGELLDDGKFSTMARETVSAFEAEMLQHPWLFPGLLGGVVTVRLGVQQSRSPNVQYKATRDKA